MNHHRIRHHHHHHRIRHHHHHHRHPNQSPPCGSESPPPSPRSLPSTPHSTPTLHTQRLHVHEREQPHRHLLAPRQSPQRQRADVAQVAMASPADATEGRQVCTSRSPQTPTLQHRVVPIVVGRSHRPLPLVRGVAQQRSLVQLQPRQLGIVYVALPSGYHFAAPPDAR